MKAYFEMMHRTALHSTETAARFSSFDLGVMPCEFRQ